MEPIDLHKALFEEILAPGEGILGADDVEEVVDYERIDGTRLQFWIPTRAFENNLSSFAETSRRAMGGAGSIGSTCDGA